MEPSRRALLTGVSGLAALALSSAPSVAASRTLFSVRSSDGTILAGEAHGDPGAPEILFIHGLRQSRLSWEKQFADPALAVRWTFGSGASCPKCFSFNIKRESGCETCQDCGHSKCG